MAPSTDTTNTPDTTSNTPLKTEPFNGDHTRTKEILAHCALNFRLNKTKYKDDADKIAYLLSLCQGGTAGPWMVDILETDPDLAGADKKWDLFKEVFRKQFSPINATSAAIVSMESLKQTGTATDYIAKFKPLQKSSGVDSVDVFKQWFFKGMNRALVEKIVGQDPSSYDSADKLYNLAERLDLAWRANQSERPSEPRRFQGGNKTSIRKLTPQDKQKLMREGRCFGCREVGHLTADCPKFGRDKKPATVRVMTEGKAGELSAEEAVVQIRRITAGLGNDQKDKVVLALENEGF